MIIQSLQVDPDHAAVLKSDSPELSELLRFFAVADVTALDEVWLKPAQLRRSPTFQPDVGSHAAWLRLAERQAEKIPTSRFDAGRCRATIPKMRAVSTLPGVEWIEPVRDACASAGIALVILKELPNAASTERPDGSLPKRR